MEDNIKDIPKLNTIPEFQYIGGVAHINNLGELVRVALNMKKDIELNRTEKSISVNRKHNK